MLFKINHGRNTDIVSSKEHKDQPSLALTFSLKFTTYAHIHWFGSCHRLQLFIRHHSSAGLVGFISDPLWDNHLLGHSFWDIYHLALSTMYRFYPLQVPVDVMQKKSTTRSSVSRESTFQKESHIL